MLINNKNIREFKAKLMDRSIEPATFSVFNDWSDDKVTPFIKDKFYYKYKVLTFTLDIICKNSNELEMIKGKLIKELAIAEIKFDDISYYYKGFIDGAPGISYIMPGNETIKIKMLVTAQSEEMVENINKATSKTINVLGDIETTCIVEITLSKDMDEIIIDGFGSDSIIIKKLKTNQVIIIDGNKKTITVNGTNKFIDTVIWEFPVLKPGSNIISASTENCDMKIKYNPRFI